MSDPVGEVMALADSYGDLLMRWNSTTADEVADARAALESRVRELERDAARYRWLREQQWFDNSGLFVVAGSKSQVRLGTDCPSFERLDTAIDSLASRSD